MNEARQRAVEEKLSALKLEIEERRKNIPAHSIRPHQLLVLEELEERARELEACLAQLGDLPSGSA